MRESTEAVMDEHEPAVGDEVRVSDDGPIAEALATVRSLRARADCAERALARQTDYAAQMERERDEARTALLAATSWLTAEAQALLDRYRDERDEARAELERLTAAAEAHVCDVERRPLAELDDAGRARVLARIVAALVECADETVWLTASEIERARDLTIGWRLMPHGMPALRLSLEGDALPGDTAIAIRGTLVEDGDAPVWWLSAEALAPVQAVLEAVDEWLSRGRGYGPVVAAVDAWRAAGRPLASEDEHG